MKEVNYRMNELNSIAARIRLSLVHDVRNQVVRRVFVQRLRVRWQAVVEIHIAGK